MHSLFWPTRQPLCECWQKTGQECGKKMFNLGWVGSEPHQNGPGCKSNRICLLSTLWQPCLWNATLKEEVTLCFYLERNSKMVAIDIHTSWQESFSSDPAKEVLHACFSFYTQDVISAFVKALKLPGITSVCLHRHPKKALTQAQRLSVYNRTLILLLSM